MTSQLSFMTESLAYFVAFIHLSSASELSGAARAIASDQLPLVEPFFP